MTTSRPHDITNSRPDEPTILWRWLDRAGAEFARLSRRGGDWQLAGAAVLEHERLPCRLDYRLTCDAAWRTIGGMVIGWVGSTAVDLELAVDESGDWWLNGERQPQVAGCVDLDLNFSPSTNLLPIRRLSLEVGKQAAVRAAWLRFPSFQVEPLEQTYARTGPATYRYTSGGGSFSADLEVNSVGFVTRYAGIWEAVAAS